MFAGWFRVAEVDEFTDSIVADLIKRLPPTGVDAPAKKAVEKLRRAHDVIFSRIEDFAGTHGLTLYKKAHMANRIKWALAEAGYPSDFVDTLTIELLTVVTYASRAHKKALS